jgi:hypothetical protein
MTLHDNGKQILRDLAWPTAMLLGLILMSSVGLVVAALFAPANELGKVMAEAHGISRLVALLLVIPSIVGLTILDKVEGSAALAALSAVVGYILGSSTGGGQ